MSADTILSPGEIGRIAMAAWCDPELDDGALVLRLARTIEQAVLQSEQMQAWKKDSGRYRWATALDDNAETLYSIVLSYGGDQAKINERVDAYRPDAAMETVMSKVTMPEPVTCWLDKTDFINKPCVTTTQAEAYADARAAESQQWQPIEIAPKDGRTILLGYYNSHGKWRTMRGQWMSEAYIAEHWEDPDDEQPGWFETSVEADDIPSCWRIEPSHWMPLPAPPAQPGPEVQA